MRRPTPTSRALARESRRLAEIEQDAEQQHGSAMPPSTALVRYDAMCRAIDNAYEVDEVKDIRDKALAIEIYSRQAQNIENERRACEIRLRAERKAGQLLREMEKAKAGPPIRNPSRDTTNYRGAPTLRDLGVTADQSSKWQKLAAVPQDDFDAALAAPEKPSTAGIIAKAAPEPEPKRDKVGTEALWLWGRLKDFEREGLLALDPVALVATMLPHMQETTKDLVPRVVTWLQGIVIGNYASMFEVEPRSVALASVIRIYGTAEEIEAVEQGRATLASIISGWQS